MTCDREKLSHYLDGELSREEIRQLRQHLATCERCADDLASFRDFADSLDRLDRPAMPDDLRRTIYQRVDVQRQRRSRWGWAGPLLSPAVPLTAGLLLVMGGVAFWRTLPPSAAPIMTAAFAVQETPESLDGLRLQLVFDRPVAPESLAEAVTVDPPLPMAQRVHENKVELIPRASVEAGASYRVTVSNVRDQQGNTQAEPVVLSLQTDPIASLVQESVPAPVVPPASIGQAPAASAPRSSTAPAPGSARPASAPESRSPRRGGQSAAVSPPAAAAASQPEAVASPAAASAPAATPVATTEAPPVVAVASPAPAASPAAVAAAVPSAVPKPEPPAQAQAEQPPNGPTLAAASTQVQSIEAAAERGIQLSAPAPSAAAARAAAPPDPAVELRRLLGVPTAAEKPVQVGEQSFQGGAMLYRSDTGQVYALIRSTGGWLSFPNTWRQGEVLTPLAGVRPPGTLQPLRFFGKTWLEQPAVKLQLGWAVYEERNELGSVQTFERGLLIRAGHGVAYLLANDATWRSIPAPRP